MQVTHALTHTRAHRHAYRCTHIHLPVCSPPPAPSLMFLPKTQLSAHVGQQMAQAAFSYLLLNIICFIHFAPQMHYHTWLHSQLSVKMIQNVLLLSACNETRLKTSHGKQLDFFSHSSLSLLSPVNSQ